MGTRRTFLIFALAIAVVAVLGLRPLRRWALAPVAIAALIAVPVGTLKAEADDGRVIYETETAYQYARVVRAPGRGPGAGAERGAGPALASTSPARCSPAATGTGSWCCPSPHSAGRRAEWRSWGMPPARPRGPTARSFPRTWIDGVEIDSELSEIGRRYFDMTNPRLRLHHEDARPYLRRTDARYDVIALDTYRQPYIPFYLSTVEFFELARDRLGPGGVVLVNVGHPEGQDGLEEVLTATMGQVFPTSCVTRSRTPTRSSRRVTARPRRAGCGRRSRRSRRGSGGRRARRRGGSSRRSRGGAVYTDDRAPVEWLIDESIVDYAAGGD